jgi:pimeloyl-ACP methyl ester carboxylesterase
LAGDTSVSVSQGARVRRGYVDTALGQTHYREAGSGEPIVLFHRTPSSSACFSRVLPLLGQRFWAIAPDNPGFGMSDPLTGPPGPTMEPYVAAAVDFLDAKGIERATLVGHSTGSAIVTHLAASHPDRVERLVIAGYTGCATDQEVDELFAVLKTGMSSTWGQPVTLDGTGAFLDEYPLTPLRNVIGRFDDPDHFVMEMISHLQGLPNYEWPFQAVLAFPGPVAVYPDIKCPVLFINAQSGMGYTFGKRAHERFPGSHYTEIEGTSEYPMQNPSAFADVITRFVDTDAA